MLVRLEDHKGVVRWVNPTYVRLLRSRAGKTEVWVLGEASPVKVSKPLDQVAEQINEALLLAISPAPGALLVDQQGAAAAQQAAGAAGALSTSG